MIILCFERSTKAVGRYADDDPNHEIRCGSDATEPGKHSTSGGYTAAISMRRFLVRRLMTRTTKIDVGQHNSNEDGDSNSPKWLSIRMHFGNELRNDSLVGQCSSDSARNIDRLCGYGSQANHYDNVQEIRKTLDAGVIGGNNKRRSGGA